MWDLNKTFISDPNAFLFSLRRNGLSNNKKFKVTKPEYAIRGAEHENKGKSWYGPTFGGGYDVYIRTNSNSYTNKDGLTSNFSSFGHSYELPPGIINGSNDAFSYLAGSGRDWFTTEIETYQIFF